MAIESDQSERFDPLGEIKELVIRLHSQGKLPILLLGFVVLYNILIFTYPTGYELYNLIPIIATVIIGMTAYWDHREDHRKQLIARVFLFVGVGVDIIVSISFIPNPWGYDWGSLPTLIADILVIVTYGLWYFERGIDYRYLTTEVDVEIEKEETFQAIQSKSKPS